MKHFANVSLLLLLSFFIAYKAAAHKISVFSYSEGNKIFVESYFTNGDPVKNAKVEIYKDGRLICQGKTDSEGSFSKEVTKKGKYKIVVTASMGHKSETYVEVSKIPNDLSESNVKSKDSLKNLDENTLRKIVAEEIEKRTKPILEILEEMKKEGEEPSLKDVFSGIGYIFGIMGIVAYIMSKKSR